MDKICVYLRVFYQKFRQLLTGGCFTVKDVFYAWNGIFWVRKMQIFFESTVAIPIRESIGLFNVQSNMG